MVELGIGPSADAFAGNDIEPIVVNRQGRGIPLGRKKALGRNKRRGCGQCRVHTDGPQLKDRNAILSGIGDIKMVAPRALRQAFGISSAVLLGWQAGRKPGADLSGAAVDHSHTIAIGESDIKPASMRAEQERGGMRAWRYRRWRAQQRPDLLMPGLQIHRATAEPFHKLQ